jgi:Bacterial membrane protein YfhO
MSAGEHIVATAWTIWLMWPFIRPDRYVVGFDTLAYTGPNFAVGRRQWTAGHIPFWDSGIFGGVPHLANPQTGELYPLKFLGYFFNNNRAIGLLAALHMIILANGLVVFVTRRLSLRSPAGLVAVVAFTGSGMGMTKSVQFEQLLVLTWLPWICVCIHGVFFGNHQRRWMVGLAAATGLTLLAGHPQVVYIEAPLLLVVAAVCAWLSGRWRRVGWIVIAGALGVMLAAPQLLLIAQATGRAAVTEVAKASEKDANGFAVNPARVVQTLLGNPRNTDPVAASGGFETVSFLGVTVALLALMGAGVSWRRRRGPTLLLVITAVSGVLLSFGPFTIFYRAARKLVPGVSFARVPARWMIIPTFLAALAAAAAIDALRVSRLPVRSFRKVLLAALLIALASAIGSVQAPGRLVVGAWLGAAALVVGASWLRPRWLAATLLLVLVVGEMGRYNNHSFARGTVRRESVNELAGAVPKFLAGQPGRSLAVTNDAADTPYLVNGLRPNANNLYGARSIDGYDGGVQVTTRWLAAMGKVAGGELNPAVTLRGQVGGPLNTAALADVGVRYLVLESRRGDASTLSQGWTGPVLTDATIQVWENPRWLGEAVVASPTGAAAAKVTKRRDGSMTVATHGAAGMLRIDEQFTPDWRVTVDGKTATPVEVGQFLVGVSVPAGQHAVTFTYGSSLFWRGLALTGASLVVLLGVLLFDRQRTVSRYREIDFDPPLAATVDARRRKGSDQTAASPASQPHE